MRARRWIAVAVVAVITGCTGETADVPLVAFHVSGCDGPRIRVLVYEGLGLCEAADPRGDGSGLPQADADASWSFETEEAPPLRVPRGDVSLSVLCLDGSNVAYGWGCDEGESGITVVVEALCLDEPCAACPGGHCGVGSFAAPERACVTACPPACDDADGDGHDAEECGGDDCDDADGDVHPGAGDLPADCVDLDCNPGPDLDSDGDGHDAEECGGDDCDDDDGDVHPGAADPPADCVDLDCDPDPDLDADGDGDEHVAQQCGGDDCDDDNPLVYPDAPVVDCEDLDCEDDDDLAPLHALPDNADAGTWSLESVPEPEEVPPFAGEPAIALEPGGAVHLAFQAGTAESSGLYHATNASGEWVTSPVAAARPDHPRRPVGIAYGDDGAVHIAYFDVTDPGNGGADLRYARIDELGIETKLIEQDTGWDPISSSPIGLDADGNAYVAYTHHRNGGLRLAVLSEEGETPSDVDPGPNTGYAPDLVVEPDGTCHIVYGSVGGDEALWYATNDGAGDWALQADDAVSPCSRPSISLGADGTLHVACRRGEFRLVHAWVSTGDVTSWDSEELPVQVGTEEVGPPSAALDARGEIQVTYSASAGSPGLFRLFRRAATCPWVTDTIDDLNETEGSAIVFGVDGIPRVAYAVVRAVDDFEDRYDAQVAALPAADGIDQNCDGVDGLDADGDGHAAEATGGDDCDDQDDTIHPGAPVVHEDGVDQDCDCQAE